MASDNPRLYLETCLEQAGEKLAGYQCPAEVAEALEDINAYPGLAGLGPPQSLRLLSDSPDGQADMGRRAVLEGRVLWEHAAAGEATRMGLGPKFFYLPEQLAALAGADAPDILPVRLGLRHLGQLLLEIRRLADESGFDPDGVLARQTFLLVGSESSVGRMSSMAARAFARIVPLRNLLFMGQTFFPGLDRKPGGGWHFDPASPKKLHNHGHMVMQKIMDEQVFRLDSHGHRVFLSRAEFFSRLAEFENLISSNIEDLDYLTGALDLSALGLASRLGHAGFGMLMEIARNNLARPVKGGLCALDPALGRDVVVESFRLRDIQPRDMRFINRNNNHYPRPAVVMRRLQEEGLFMPVTVSENKVYFCPVQGDLNFLVKTAFFTRGETIQINSLKTQGDVRAALKAMAAQDASPDFRSLAPGLVGL
ncbi:MAG: hypothetical protein LBO05_02750 [Deltaproteobacteria bacterium]|jgi:hypothetical protein|nr:hypothetical protein [Deltaproteobacteria bacterium]